MVEIVSEKFVLDTAESALKDILSNTKQVLSGNGVNNEGEMYPDVKVGLKLALEIVRSLKKERE